MTLGYSTSVTCALSQKEGGNRFPVKYAWAVILCEVCFRKGNL